jgi:mRNA-degrading endonuclease RelE of RelBE toxin-antitoxin system
MPAWTVKISRSAGKSVEHAEKRDQERLLDALDSMAADPRSGDVVPLRNERAAFRRRVGDWRIFFDLSPNDQTVEVVAIERRTTTTYRKRR